MRKMIFGCLAIALVCATGCTKALYGPCYSAMQYRRDAGKLPPDAAEKAVLLGKADAAQRECDAQSMRNQEQQKRDATTRQR